MESLVIRHDLRKIWTAAVGLVLLAALEGAFLWLVHDLSNPVSAVLTLVLGILWAALLLLAAANVLAAVRLGGAPALVVDDRGVTDRTTLGSVGLIPWEQALAFVPGRGTSRGFVIVHYADPRWPGRRLRGRLRGLRAPEPDIPWERRSVTKTQMTVTAAMTTRMANSQGITIG